LNVRAKYLVHSQKAEEHGLSVPLAGVRLGKATLDGCEAFPDAGQPDRFLVPIRGQGSHELILQFAVPVQSTGIDREAKFTAPDLPVAHVGFAAGLRGRQLDIPSRNGGQSLGVSAEGWRVDAEQGGGRTIRLRWREGGAAEGAKPSMSVKEVAVWDLGEGGSLLTAAWQYRVEGGAVAALRIECPDHVLPTEVSLESTDGPAAGLGIRNWKAGPAANGMIPIDVRLQSPVEGRFTLVLRGCSTWLPTTRPVLTFPRSADVAEADRDSFHAVRIAGVVSEGVAIAGAIDYPAEAVARDFAKVPEFNFAKSPPARVVRRAGGKATELRPILAAGVGYQPLAGEVGYTIGRRVEAEGAMRASAKESGAVEFDVPAGLIPHDVWAPGLAGWGRFGSRIQVWLNQPSADVIVRWAGHWPNATSPDGTIALPLPRWPSATAKLADPVQVRVRPAPEWTVAPLAVAGLKIKPSSVPEEWLLAPEPDQNPIPKFKFRHAPKAESGVERTNLPPAGSGSPPIPAVASVPPLETAANSEERAHRTRWKAVAWLFLIALVAAVPWRGRRQPPEVFLMLGLCAAVILGGESILSIPFWIVAGYGALLRGWWIGRRLLRSAVG